MLRERTEYKLSRYLVASVPVFKQTRRMLMSTRSLATYLLPTDLYDTLQRGEFDTIDRATMDLLLCQKMVVPRDEDELENVIRENKHAIATDTTLYTAIAPSADCQLDCDYCGQTHTKDRIGAPLQQKLVERIGRKLAVDKRFNRLEIAWFGGEPLMGLKSIRTLSAGLKALASAAGADYNATMVTNGLALTPEVFFELARDCALRDAEITLDGSARYHNARRYSKKGHASFDLIVRNLSAIVNDPRFPTCGTTLTIRCNVDARNQKGADELLLFLEDQQLLQHVNFYTAPVHSWGNDAHLAALDYLSYAEFEIDMLAQLIKKKRGVPLLPLKRTKIVCMSLKRDAELIDAYGDVYNCSEVSQVAAYKDVKIYKLADLNSDHEPLLPMRPFSDWNDDILTGVTPCHDCRILPVCGGACPKLWREEIAPCPAIKQNIEQRLLLQLVELSRSGALSSMSINPTSKVQN